MVDGQLSLLSPIGATGRLRRLGEGCYWRCETKLRKSFFVKIEHRKIGRYAVGGLKRKSRIFASISEVRVIHRNGETPGSSREVGRYS